MADLLHFEAALGDIRGGQDYACDSALALIIWKASSAAPRELAGRIGVCEHAEEEGHQVFQRLAKQFPNDRKADAAWPRKVIQGVQYGLL